MEFSELEVCHKANLNLIAWVRGEYTIQEKSMIMAWAEGHHLVELHSSDAQTIKKRK